MITPRQLAWWGLDYLYASQRQLSSLFHRHPPVRLKQGDVTKPAIILLPGVYESWLFLEAAAKRLNTQGFRVFTVPDLGLNRLRVPESAMLLTARIAALAAQHDISQCILLAHSKGGLIGKHAMLEAAAYDAGANLPADGTFPEVLGMVAVATPFSGSPYARFQLSRTLRDFSPSDAVLRWLSSQTAVNHKIVSIYPVFDPHIPGGSMLAGAQNIELPVSGHFRLLSDETVLAAVEHALEKLAAGRAGPSQT